MKLPVAMCAVVLCCMLLCVPKPFQNFAYLCAEGEAVVFCRQSTSPCCSVGNGVLVQCSVANLSSALSTCSGVEGVSFVLQADIQTFQRILQVLCLQNTSTIFLDGTQVVSGFCPRVKGGVMVDGSKVNIQAAFDGQRITIGSPLILNGF